MVAQAYPDDIDLVWIAADDEGRVGAFVTAGAGPVPTAVLAGEIPIADLEMMACDLPVVGGAQVLVSVNDPESFVRLAARGFFVYDWSDIHRTTMALGAYELVARPDSPLDLGRLTPNLRLAAEAARMASISFSEASLVDPMKHVLALRGTR